MRRFVGYYRVSTQGQGTSGLGLRAQQSSVERYVKSMQGELIGEFQDVGSGADFQRKKLQQAIRLCREKKAQLVIAKLDRLARSVRFIAELKDSGIDFVATDMPEATPVTVHILAAIAEHERTAISDRTKRALRAAKERGVTLGNPNAALASPLGVAANRKKADEFALNLMPTLRALRAGGVSSYAALAAVLDAHGVKTQRGGRWTAAGVRNVMLRAEALEGAAKAG